MNLQRPLVLASVLLPVRLDACGADPVRYPGNTPSNAATFSSFSRDTMEG